MKLKHGIILLAIGLCAEARGDFAAAQAAFTASTSGDLFKERAQWNQARVYAKQGNKAKAVEIYKEMLAKGDPKSSLRDDIQNRLSQLEQEVLLEAGGDSADLAENPLVFVDDETQKRLQVFGPLDQKDEIAIQTRFNGITG